MHFLISVCSLIGIGADECILTAKAFHCQNTISTAGRIPSFTSRVDGGICSFFGSAVEPRFECPPKEEDAAAQGCAHATEKIKTTFCIWWAVRSLKASYLGAWGHAVAMFNAF